MTDNPAYRLKLAAEAARDKAGASLDPHDHAIANALEGVESAEVYATERAAHDRIHGVSDPATFPRWSEVSEPGDVDRWLVHAHP